MRPLELVEKGSLNRNTLYIPVFFSFKRFNIPGLLPSLKLTLRISIIENALRKRYMNFWTSRSHSEFLSPSYVKHYLHPLCETFIELHVTVSGLRT